MPETRAQAARNETEKNNGESCEESERNSPFEKKLLAMLSEHRALLVEYKDQQERRVFEIARAAKQ